VRFSLAKKLILIYLLVVVLLTGVLGVVLTSSYRTELTQMRANELTECATEITKLFETGQLSIVDSLYLNFSLSTLAKNYHAVFLLADSDGNVMYEITADGMKGAQPARTLDTNVINTLENGKNYVREGYYNKEYNAMMVTVAVPIINQKTGDLYCMINISSNMNNINDSYYKILSKLWLPILSAVIIGIVLVSFLTYRVTFPLKEMSNASRQIAKGNFDKVLDIKSNDEIGDLADSYNIMAKELAKSESMKRDFVANITHELRSPMTSINGFVQGMLDGTIAEADYKHYLNIVSVETQRLNKLITEMLDLSRIESGVFPLNKSSFDLNELLRRVIIKFSQNLDEKNIELDINLPEGKTMVYADPDRIEQVVQNIFDNAVKFTPDGKSIRIWTVISNDKVFVTIEDSGQGIEEEHLPYIWDRFFTADRARTSSKNGTGLGLPIVKKILDQHKQEIKATSVLSKGSTFTFTLELSKIIKKEF